MNDPHRVRLSPEAILLVQGIRRERNEALLRARDRLAQAVEDFKSERRRIELEMRQRITAVEISERLAAQVAGARP